MAKIQNLGYKCHNFDYNPRIFRLGGSAMPDTLAYRLAPHWGATGCKPAIILSPAQRAGITWPA